MGPFIAFAAVGWEEELKEEEERGGGRNGSISGSIPSSDVSNWFPLATVA